MSDEATPEETPEQKPEVNNEARFKAERDRAKARLEETSARLAELEAAMNERKAADEKAEAERKKKAGDFESIEADLNARLATEAERAKALAESVAAYEKRDTDRIESILKDRKDADEIRATFEGLPVGKQLALAERFLAESGAQPAAPTGKPGSLGGESVSADLQAKAEQFYPGDEAQQKIFIEQYGNVIKERGAAAQTDGWPVTQPGGRNE